MFEKIDKHEQKPFPQRKRRKMEENEETKIENKTSADVVKKDDITDEVLRSYWHEAIISTIPKRKNFKIVDES